MNDVEILVESARKTERRLAEQEIVRWLRERGALPAPTGGVNVLIAADCIERGVYRSAPAAKPTAA